MMIDKSKISRFLPHLSDELISEIASVAIFKEIPSGSTILTGRTIYKSNSNRDPGAYKGIFEA